MWTGLRPVGSWCRGGLFPPVCPIWVKSRAVVKRTRGGTTAETPTPSAALPHHRVGAHPAGPARTRSPDLATGTALAALETLPVKGRAPMTGYDRAAFGPEWLDADGNGCDTRNALLSRDLRRRVYDPSKHGG